MRAMQAQELKTLVETGAYKPDPDLIATAMLQRQGVRELLTGIEDVPAPSDRTPSAAAMRPRAA